MPGLLYILKHIIVMLNFLFANSNVCPPVGLLLFAVFFFSLGYSQFLVVVLHICENFDFILESLDITLY